MPHATSGLRWGSRRRSSSVDTASARMPIARCDAANASSASAPAGNATTTPPFSSNSVAGWPGARSSSSTAARSRQARRATMASSASAPGALSETRMLPSQRLEVSAATPERSTTTTSAPASANARAHDAPMAPAPITTTRMLCSSLWCVTYYHQRAADARDARTRNLRRVHLAEERAIAAALLLVAPAPEARDMADVPAHERFGTGPVARHEEADELGVLERRALELVGVGEVHEADQPRLLPELADQAHELPIARELEQGQVERRVGLEVVLEAPLATGSDDLLGQAEEPLDDVVGQRARELAHRRALEHQPDLAELAQLVWR